MSSISHSILLVLLVLLMLCTVGAILGTGCKDIVASNDATAGDYQLLLKVRDPSRPGLQVLCMVPAGYNYTYHLPWTGKPLLCNVKHKFIGVATINDTIPNIVKAGMAFSDRGIAYGDADTMSNWVNPTKYAWDDFDWIRYACQQADTEDEARDLLTKDVVDTRHAPGVSENLFVVGPEKAMVIEADVVHFTVNEIHGVLAMSNYPHDLWETQRHNKLSIASSFDTEHEQEVREGQIVHLQSVYGIKIMDIARDHITVREDPLIKITNRQIRFMGNPIDIPIDERKTVGDFSVKLLGITGNKAQVSVSTMVYAWEQTLLDIIQPSYGHITVEDMMNWSRLHPEDLDGMRPMCEDLFPYESAMIYKIPGENYQVLSSGWFAANHPCASIYVPVHIADTHIYEPYTNGDAAQLSLDLLTRYGHGTLNTAFHQVETVFLSEITEVEPQAIEMIQNNSDPSDLLTVVDTGMQKQAWLTEQLWQHLGEINDTEQQLNIRAIIETIWEKNYSVSLEHMDNAIVSLCSFSESDEIINQIIDIMFSITETRLAETTALYEKH